MLCPVCSHETVGFETAVIMQKYEGRFRRCPSCHFIFAEDPVWLDEAYRNVISVCDVGLVDRNIWFSRVARAVVSVLCNRTGRFLDYGGGTGLFTRLMRDAGYDWYWYDRYCHNSCAEGFSADIESGEGYELITAVELFEHIADPVKTVAVLKKLSSHILFTTSLLPTPPPPLSAWWYYGLEHGQHISLYDIRSLRVLARNAGMHLASNGSNLHLLSTKKVPDLFMKIVASNLFGRLIYPQVKW